MNQQQPGQVEVQSFQEPSTGSEKLIELFAEAEHKQVDFLNEFAKSLIERISTFLAILLGLSVLGNSFPQAYLRHNSIARFSILITLVCYLAAMATAIWAIQPRFRRRYIHNVTALEHEYERIIQHKMFWLRVSVVLFFGGSIALAAFIISLVWATTQ